MWKGLLLRSRTAWRVPGVRAAWTPHLRRYSLCVDAEIAALQGPELEARIAAIPIERYRNFSIVAHVDHGKSTLSDRLLELTGVIAAGGQKQFLDKLDVERERGITVKAQTCTMLYNHKGEDYLLHLVDTPGHVDFRAEVSRSYASCGGALLLVDASQGVQAQTVANFFLAFSLNLTLLPVINKIDLDVADIPRSMDQIETTFELPTDNVLQVSAKTGLNVDQILPNVIENIPGPDGKVEDPLRALIVDSWYDNYLGVVLLTYVRDGVVSKGSKIMSHHTGKKYDVKEVGIMYPGSVRTKELKAGQVGYMALGMKSSTEAHTGDTLIKVNSNVEPLPGFAETKPMVFVGVFPGEGMDFTDLEESLQHLTLNDRSVTMTKATSQALGQGWRMGFLGTLHASVFEDRLLQEHGAHVIITAPSVPYRVVYHPRGKETESTIVEIDNPANFPDLQLEKARIEALQEPMVACTMTLPQEYIGAVMSLCEANRGEQVDMNYLNQTQVLLKYRIPLNQLVEDFFGKLKAASQGFASLDYEEDGYMSSKLVRLDMCVNGEVVDALSQVMHVSQAETRARDWVAKFKTFLRWHQFDVIIQAKIGNKILARETIKARKKDVLAKLHAADLSRKAKLLKNQKAGKNRLQTAGRVTIPKVAFSGFLSKA
ncbi:Translation factor GUF1 [Yarrowia sp. E02]|nr:Translation factor GUF1 [Yarrowia sp. E02]